MKNKDQRKGLSRREFKEMAVQKQALSFSISQAGQVINDRNEAEKIIDLALNHIPTLYKLAEEVLPLANGIDLISSIIAGTDIFLYRNKDGEDQLLEGDAYKKHILVKPNTEDDQFTFLYKTINYYYIEGGAYWIYSSDGKNKTLTVVKPHRIQEEYNASTGELIGYKLPYSAKPDYIIDPKFVRKIGKPSFSDSRKFKSIMKSVMTDVFMNTESGKFLIGHLKDGLLAKGLLYNINVDQLGSSSAVKNLKDFTAKSSGERGVKMLAPGWDYKTIQESIIDSQVLQTSELGAKNINRGLQLPDSMYNSEVASYATADVQRVEFYKKTIAPLCQLIVRVLNTWEYTSSQGTFYKFELGNLVSAEEENYKATTFNTLASACATVDSLKLASKNELRIKLGLEPIDNPDADINPIESEGIESEDRQALEEENEELSKMLEIEKGLFTKDELFKLNK